MIIYQKQYMKAVIVLIMCFFLLVSCNNELNILDIDKKITNSNLKLDEKEIDFANELPVGVELVTNTEKYTILKYQIPTSEEGAQEIVLDFTSGGSEDKFIYGVFTGYIKEEYRFVAQYDYGFLNSDFSILTEAVYESVYPFVNEVAIVKSEEGYGVINSYGVEIISCSQLKKPIFQNKYIIFKNSNSVLTEYQFFNIKTGLCEFSVIKLYGNKPDSFELTKVNLAGNKTKIVIDDMEYSRDLYPYQDVKSELHGYKDIFDRIIIEPIFTEAYPFQQGFARIKHDYNYGFIDSNGKLVIDIVYEKVFDFKNDYARVVQNGKYGFIDKNGKLIIDCEYALAKNFSDGLAAVTKNGDSWIYINTSGEEVFNEEFRSAGNFSHGYAPVFSINLGVTVFINKDGVISFNERTFTQATDINEGGFSIAKNIVSLNTGTTEVIYIIAIKKGNTE